MKILLFFTGLLFFGAVQSQTAPVFVTVRNAAGKVCVNDRILFKGQKDGKVVTGVTDQKGTFLVQLPEGEVYNIVIETLGEDVDYNTIEVPTIPEGAVFERMDVEITYEAAKNYVLAGLLFETASDNIQQSSFKALDEIAAFLLRKKELKIEISGHTDSDGDAAANQSLSQKRANAVKNYLLSKGVSASRITAIGYGETRPVASNDSATGKQQNRRTEIKIL